MTPEHLTNEELAGYLASTMNGRAEFAIPVKISDEGVEFKNYAYTHLAHEAARRLRNSIPKPVVDVTFDDFDSAYYIVVNNQRCGRFIYDRILANTLADDIRKALGLEGGGDE